MRGRLHGFHTASLAAALALAATAWPPAVHAAGMTAHPVEPNVISRLSARAVGSKTVIVVHGSTTPSFTAYRLDQPPRLVVDIANGRLGLGSAEERQLLADTWAVGQVSIDERIGDTTHTSRVIVTLKRPGSYTVKPQGQDLHITIIPDEEQPPDRSEELLQAHKALAAQEAQVRRQQQEATQALESARAEREKIARDLDRLEQLRAELSRQEKDIAQRQRQDEQTHRASQEQLQMARREAARAQQELEAAQAALRKAEQARAQAESAQRTEQVQRSMLLQQQREAERLLVEQTATLKAQQAEIARLQALLQQRTRQAQETKRSQRLAEEQALKRLLEQRQHTLAELNRLEQTRADMNRQQQELNIRLQRQQQEQTAQVRQAQQQAARAQQEMLAAQAALRQAEKAREEMERARLAEEARLKELLKARQVAERQVAEQTALLKAQQAEIARLEQLQRARHSEQEAERQAQQQRLLAEQALLKAQERRRDLEMDLSRLEQARQQRLQQERELSARLLQAQREGGSRLEALRRELNEAQQQAAQLQEQVAAAQQAIRQAELARQQAAERQKEEAERLQALRKAQQQAEAERKAVEQARRAELQRLAELKQKADAEQQALERTVQAHREQEQQLAALRQKAEVALHEEQARLQALQRARQEAEVAQQRHLAEVRQRTESERQREEAQLQALLRARQQVERDLQRMEQEQRAQAQRLAQLRQQAEAEQLRAALSVQLATATSQGEAAPVSYAWDEVEGFSAPPRVLRQAVTLRPYVSLPPQRPAPQLEEAEEELRQPVVARASLRAEARISDEARPASALKPGPLIPVRDVRFEDDGRVARVIIVLGAANVETTVYSDSRTAVLRLHNVLLPKELARTLDATAYNGPVQSVSSFPDPRTSKTVRLVVSLSRPVAPTLHRQGTQLWWEFPRPVTSVVSLPSMRVAGFGTPFIPMQVGNSQPPKAPVTAGRRFRRYEGRRIDLDFKDADIHNILRLLSDVGQVNIITTDDVKGTVTIRMRDVPWDQALDVVLKAKGLGSVREGNLIRVAPQEKLDKEAEAEAARMKSRVELQPIETRLIPLSYADATKMEKKVQDVLSPRGKVTVDERTNVLIISDMAANIALAEDLLRNLDTQVPQVLIEARIVEARANFVRTLGLQWGGNFLASTASGNPTGLTFPSTVGVGGGAVDQQTDVTPRNGLGPNAANPGYIVNLPAAVGLGSGGALGIALGSIAGTVNINLRLSALENTGNVRVISAPKITTTDNFEASIEQGVSIPVSVVSAAGTNTQFFNAVLNLTVKPRVTNDGYVGMELKVTRNEPDFANVGARGDPSILKREAKTNMLVRDGDTAVIGGIYTRNTGQSYQKVPFLAEIPILGWLFKNRRDNDDRNELLIFITPRIMNRPGQQNPAGPAR